MMISEKVPEKPPSFLVLGVPVHVLSDYHQWLTTCLHQRQGCHVVTLNAEMAMEAEKNPPLAKIIHNAELVIPDGAGVVLYLRWNGKRVQRCPGIELAEDLLRQAGKQGSECPVFFYGGAPEVAQNAAQIWQERIPGLTIVGVENGFLTPEQQSQMLETLAKVQPAVILVGMGVPRQELWISQHRHLCPNSIWVGVGGSFDIWSGVKTRAPEWLRNNHLEWLYRLYKEPWRWRRMLALPKFAIRALIS